MDNKIDAKRYRTIKQRFYYHFDEMCIDYSVVDVMCLDSMDMVEEIIRDYESALARLGSLVRYYENIISEETDNED